MPNNTIGNCSDSVIKTSISRSFSRKLPKTLINRNNHYLIKTIDKTNQLTSSNIIKPKDLQNYIGASSIQHCYDAWNFLSRGVASIFFGDVHTSIHMLYYSELRAVMSMMASLGIGVFDRNHVYYDNNSVPNFVPKLTTHKYASGLFDALANTDTKNDKIFNVMSVQNKSLSEWIQAANSSLSSKYVVDKLSSYLQDWGVDIKLHDDQKLRNEVTYRPHFVSHQVNQKRMLLNFTEIWKLLEPEENNPFMKIDQFIVRVVLKEIWSYTTQIMNQKNYSNTKTNQKNYTKYLCKVIDAVGINLDPHLLKYFNSQSEPILFKLAKKRYSSLQDYLKDPLPMVCRSILLLRLSTGLVAQNIGDVRDLGVKLSSWWIKRSAEIGIDGDLNNGIKPMDLHQDIKEAYLEIISNIPPQISCSQLHKQFASNLFVLNQFQRVCFWSLGI